MLKDYVVSWTDHQGVTHRPRFTDETSARIFAYLVGRQAQIAFVPEGREDEAYLVLEAPL